MTVVHMSEEGQIVVPKEIRDRRGYNDGSAFALVETKSGALVLRPVTKPDVDIVDYLLTNFKGVSTVERKHHCRPRVQ